MGQDKKISEIKCNTLTLSTEHTTMPTKKPVIVDNSPVSLPVEQM